jgi:2-oxo-3-hexenedioate decarboxylase
MPLSPQELLSHLDANTLWPTPFGLPLHEAYEHQLAVREMRIGRGERPLGFKIGFTNRTLWDRYGVHAPIWGTVYDTTVRFCEDAGELDIGSCSQPRIEPECVFGMARTPPARAGLDELFGCIEWVACGFEVVQSHMPQWKFVVADTAADGGLHGCLLVGRKVPVREVAATAAEFESILANTRVELMHAGQVKDRGTGSNVLDGPLHALLHFLNELRNVPGAPDLLPGAIVTTGTWTDAWPVHPGEQWRSRYDGSRGALAGLQVTFR